MFTAISVHFTKSTTICLSRFLTIAIQHALITSVPFIYMSIDIHSNHHSFAHGNSLYCFIQLTLEFLLLTDIFNLWHWQHSASPLKFLGSNSWFCLQPSSRSHYSHTFPSSWPPSPFLFLCRPRILISSTFFALLKPLIAHFYTRKLAFSVNPIKTITHPFSGEQLPNHGCPVFK